MENNTVCDSCDGSSSQKDVRSIFQLTVCNSIESSITKFLSKEQLSDDILFDCNFCLLRDLHHSIKFVRLGLFLILQLKRFIHFNGTISKDMTKVIYYPKPFVIVSRRLVFETCCCLCLSVGKPGERKV